jgi:type II secretory pathway component PulC
VKARRGVILLVVLALVMVGLWLWVLGIVPPKKTVRELIERPVTVEVTPEELRKKAEETALSLSNWLEKQEEMNKMLVYHEGRQDPFLLLAKKKEKSLPIQPPKLVLKGIAWDETEPLALINDLVAKEGDTIQGARIVKIDFDRVAISYRGKKFVVELISPKS